MLNNSKLSISCAAPQAGDQDDRRRPGGTVDLHRESPALRLNELDHSATHLPEHLLVG
jgi:hypothetical protein